MNLGSTGSCAAQTIMGLSYGASTGDPYLNLHEFFKLSLGSPRTGSSLLGTKGAVQYNKLSAFYIFTAGPGEYGDKFAALIKKYGLGDIATCGPYQNPHYGTSGHPCQAWVWHPDQKACEKWWSEAEEKKAEREAALAKEKEEEARQLKIKQDAYLAEMKVKYGDTVFFIRHYGARPTLMPTTSQGRGKEYVGGILKPIRDYNHPTHTMPPCAYLDICGCYTERGPMENGKEYIVVDQDNAKGMWLVAPKEPPKPKEVPVGLINEVIKPAKRKRAIIKKGVA